MCREVRYQLPELPQLRHEASTRVMRTMMLFRCEWVTNGPGRCGGGGNVVVLTGLSSLDSVNDGRLGEESVGLIDDGGVIEARDEVSIVEEDLPDTTST